MGYNTSCMDAPDINRGERSRVRPPSPEEGHRNDLARYVESALHYLKKPGVGVERAIDWVFNDTGLESYPSRTKLSWRRDIRAELEKRASVDF